MVSKELCVSWFQRSTFLVCWCLNLV